ncbi:unnamed protein product [Notodromas monacha]|uniref:Uncharacterized protein n=1 Tax=Notodromas monacha TaxID=399045 RepID=A0A7R9GAX1_9CRUS|nr:unnamed protein product [Notodromas monacha]CAG0914481.1 unnamed protein product [Notodromas monacha]
MEDEVMTFYPTWEEFQDFQGYIAYMESQGAHLRGVAKIVPPKEWVPRRVPLADALDSLGDFKIKHPILQNLIPHGGKGNKPFFVVNVQQKTLPLREFVKKADDNVEWLIYVPTANFSPPPATYDDVDAMERLYWKSLSTKPTLYGADICGSLTDTDVKVPNVYLYLIWNCQHLPSILDCLKDDYTHSTIDGVNTPYLYFGMWKTTFAAHTEDMDLYSINYNHHGAPKFWYALAPSMARKFERNVRQTFVQEFKQCPGFLRHKSLLFPPTWFKFYSIPFFKGIQREGEFMITFPMAYHWGFNFGFNIAESTNFATERWIEYGKRCVRCVCEPDRVNISMEAFVRRFQPDQYKDWLWGNDLGTHPAYPKDRKTPAPGPCAEDLECTRIRSIEMVTRLAELQAEKAWKDEEGQKREDERGRKAAERKTKRNMASKRQATARKLSESDKKLKLVLGNTELVLDEMKSEVKEESFEEPGLVLECIEDDAELGQCDQATKSSDSISVIGIDEVHGQSTDFETSVSAIDEDPSAHKEHMEDAYETESQWIDQRVELDESERMKGSFGDTDYQSSCGNYLITQEPLGKIEMIGTTHLEQPNQCSSPMPADYATLVDMDHKMPGGSQSPLLPDTPESSCDSRKNSEEVFGVEHRISPLGTEHGSDNDSFEDDEKYKRAVIPKLKATKKEKIRAENQHQASSSVRDAADMEKHMKRSLAPSHGANKPGRIQGPQSAIIHVRSTLAKPRNVERIEQIIKENRRESPPKDYDVLARIMSL